MNKPEGKKEECQRFFDRFKQYKCGIVFYSETSFPRSCIIRNFSETGAKLEIELPIQIKGRFMLLNATDNEEHICSTVWQEGNFIGVKFH